MASEELISSLLPIPYTRGRGDMVQAFIGGTIVDSWTEVSIQRSMNSLSGQFSLSIANVWREAGVPWPIKPGLPAVLKIGTDPVLTGFIDSLESSVSNSERGLSISGRDRTAGLVDCSAIMGTGEFNKQSLQMIASSLCAPFGITVLCELPATVIKKATIKAGESVFEFLSRLASADGGLLLSDSFGNLVIRNQSTKVGIPTASITQGVNVLSLSASYDEADRFSSIEVLGQAIASDEYNGLAATQIIGKATDSGVTRYRPIRIMGENALTLKTAQTRAQWEATNRAARAVSIKATVQGWRSETKRLWTTGELAKVYSSDLGIKSEFLITGVSFKQSVSEGTITELTMTRPDAFVPKPVVTEKIKNTLGW
jgi:prophage tail gpP-like protein